MTEQPVTAVESDVAPLPDAEPEPSDNRPRVDEGDLDLGPAHTSPEAVAGELDDAYDPDRDGI